MRKTCLNLCITVSVLGLAGLSLAACSKPAPANSGSGSGSAMATATGAPANAVMANPYHGKPGLWELTTNIDGMKIGPVKTTLCMDDALGEKMAKSGSQMAGDVECSKHDVMAMPNGVMIDSVCKTHKTTVTSHINITSTGDGTFHQTMESTFSPAINGRDKSNVTLDGKWLGACPATMKAGDLQMAGGMTVNMANMADKMKKKP